MNDIFLSASVPVPGRGEFYKDADPFLIQMAVRAFIVAALGRRRIIWGGHPAITPMIWAICEDIGVEYDRAVKLVMSDYFRGKFPEESLRFSNTEIIPAIAGDLRGSLRLMRERILARHTVTAAVFIGGMEGVLEEYEMIQSLNPRMTIVTVPATGGAARILALKRNPDAALDDIDFTKLFFTQLGLNPAQPRTITPIPNGGNVDGQKNVL